MDLVFSNLGGGEEMYGFYSSACVRASDFHVFFFGKKMITGFYILYKNGKPSSLESYIITYIIRAPLLVPSS